MNKREYEKIIFTHDFQYEILTKAYDIVRLYIIKTGLKLKGGMSMDFALRTKKHKLYDSYKIPDYDFISPTFTLDAYKLGNELMEAGISGVSVIRALHPNYYEGTC